MKKLFLLLFLIALFSCENPTVDKISAVAEETPPVVVADPVEPEQFIEEPEPEINDIIMVLYDGLDMRFYDGETFEIVYTSENIKFGGNQTIAVDDYLYRFDNQGIGLESIRLNGISETLLHTGSDIYNFSEYFIYKNSSSIGNFFFDVKSAAIAPTGELIATDNTDNLHNLTGSSVPFKIFDGLYIYDINYNSKTASMNGSMVSFDENYFYTARWQKCGDKFYSNYGMEFSDSGFIENSTALQDFKSTSYPYVIGSLPNAEKPSLHPAGQRYEASEYVIYFIESTSGHLIRYVPSVDQYDILPKIFYGTNNMSQGNMMAKNLNPQWIADKLYFHHEGSVKVYDPVMGSVGIFSDNMEVWAW